jgi:integrase
VHHHTSRVGSAKLVPKISLENTTVKSLPLPHLGTIDYWDAKLPAFGCRVSHGGTKTFVLKLRNSRRAIGRYPIISLADARAEAKRLLAEKTLKKRQPQSITYERARESFIAEKEKELGAGTVGEYERLLGRLSFQGQIGDISPDDFARKLDRIKAPSERNHALAAAKTFFTWAYNRRYIEDDPTRGLSVRGGASRSRVLSDDELKRVWTAAEKMGGSFGTIVRLLILTGQRRGEIAALQSSWINLDEKTITLPQEIVKNRREHTFPVSSSLLSLLTLPSTAGLLFPARGHADRPFNGWSKAKEELDEESGVSEWTLHDIRRTVATNLAALGVALPVIERLLNHVSGSFGGIVAVYQRHSFMPEMHAAVELWDKKLQELLAG